MTSVARDDMGGTLKVKFTAKVTNFLKLTGESSVTVAAGGARNPPQSPTGSVPEQYVRNFQ